MQLSKPEMDLRELQIHAERIKAVYQQATMTSINSWATALLFLFVPNDSLERSILLSWFAAITLSCIFRLVVAQTFKRRKLELEQYRFWGLLYAGAVFSTAAVWSSGLFVLVTPDNLVYQLFLMTVLIALCIGASHASTTYQILGHVYNIPVITCYVIICIMTGGTGFYVLAGLAFMFAFMMFVVGRDNAKRFTENLELRFELAQKKEEAESASLAKTKFLAAASHDLRQPLHALTLFTGLLRSEVSKPEALDIVSNIDASVEGLQDLFNSLLDFSKLEAGILAVEKDHFQIGSVLSSIENEFQFEAESLGLSFYIEPCAEYVHTDPTLLGRIIKNLVSNALRYTREGSVVVLFKKRQATLSIEVRDTGLGIPKEHQEDIFEEFVQLHNPERDRAKGLGLGLSIVRALTELLDINLRMESAPGAGTSFFLDVPLGKRLDTAESTDSKPAPMLMLDGLKTVLIDDESQIREGTQKLLQSWGCDVKAFASEQAAMDVISAENFVPDVVLADYRLEDDKTGLEAINAIRNWAGKEIFAAIVTGDTAPDRLKEAEASGHTLLHKPVKPMQLRTYLTRMKNKLE